jgi:hypothetical protein
VVRPSGPGGTSDSGPATSVAGSRQTKRVPEARLKMNLTEGKTIQPSRPGRPSALLPPGVETPEGIKRASERGVR